MEEETYYLMKHPADMNDELSLRDPHCWDESIKNKYEQQQQPATTELFCERRKWSIPECK